MGFNKKITALLGSLLILLCSLSTAFAETSLPDGAVKGLPEKLAALDDEGRAVNSETGEYFFRVENMKFGETYTKNMQLINLREDYGYHIYFYVEPLFKAGEIDLEEGCECRFLLDGKEFYKGTVNGDGNIDLKEQHFDCGYYAPGESHTLRAEVVWNRTATKSLVNNGHKLIDKDGVHILTFPEGATSVQGEIEFKWIFYAKVGTGLSGGNSSPGELTDEYAPQTGLLLKSGTFWLICIGVIVVAIAVLLVLIIRSKKKDKAEEKEK